MALSPAHEAVSSGSTMGTSEQSPATRIPVPSKPKGRQRFLQGLQRMSSSPALAKMGRSAPSQYHPGGRGTMSCASLASSPDYFSSFQGVSYDGSSTSLAGSSTPPTPAPSTPGGTDMRVLDFKFRGRRIDYDSLKKRPITPSSAPLPNELFFGSMGAALATAPAQSETHEDYFSIPLQKEKPRKRRENFDFWRDLPYELRMMVFRYLKPKEIVRASIVSKAWHRMCFDGQLWTSLDASEFYKDIPPESLIKIMTSAGPFVKDLNLRGIVQMRDRWLSQSHTITDLCRNLENLSIEQCRIDRSSIHFFLMRNPRLVHVNLSGQTGINNSTMRIVAQNCPMLEVLVVTWCSGIDTKGLRKVVQSCPRLKDLRAEEIKGFDDRDFLLDLFNLNCLERLVAAHCTDFDDESLKLLITGEDPPVDVLTGRAVVPPRRLRHLDLSRCTSLTNKGVTTLAYHCPDLAGLQLSQCSGLTDDALSGILESTPKLTHLDLEEVENLTNATLQSLAKAPCAPHLQHLSVSSCENLGDTGMLPVIHACPSLRTLEMDNTKISDLVLTEAAAEVRGRNRAAKVGNPSGRPELGLRLVVYDCQNVNWTGVREILSRNAEFYRHPFGTTAPSYPKEVISLKCFYGYQPTVEEHTKRVLKGELARATMLERKWAEYMIATEEAGAHGSGHRRRRRRAREAALVHADEEEGGARGGRRRARSGGCTVM